MDRPMHLDDTRAMQKARTRGALLAAARRLMDEGAIVSVTSAAEAAGISKATAYRYFSDPQTLTIEALLDSRMQPIEAILGDAIDPRERVQRVRDFLFTLTRDSEPQFRQFLARSMEFWLAHGGGSAELVRGGRRLPMYRTALEPVAEALGPERLNRLVNMLAATSGMESYLALKDVCRLGDAEANATAEAITDAILDRFLPAAR
jgi:AcrR family transcriptional regulator